MLLFDCTKHTNISKYGGVKDLVPCILVTFDKEQVVIWRGKDYKPAEDEAEYPPSFIHHEGL